MSVLKIPVVNIGITLNEVPDKIALYFEMGNCHQHCAGCHSPHLQLPVDYGVDLETLEELAEDAVNDGANAIVLMGGTTNGLTKEHLKCIINNLAMIAPVCLYSGSDDTEADLQLAQESNLTWLKTGSYHQNLGGLTSSKTNQRFYHKDYHITVRGADDVSCVPELIDMTDYFRYKMNGTVK